MAKRKGTTEDAVRSAAARRREKNRRKFRVYLFAMLLLSCGAGLVLSLTVFFNLESVEIRRTSDGGTTFTNLDAQELIDTSGIRQGDNLLRLRTDRILARLQEKFSYVADLRLERKFPTHLVLWVDEAVPVCFLPNGEGYLLLDQRGRVLETQSHYLPTDGTRILGFPVETFTRGEKINETEQERLRLVLSLEQLLEETNWGKLDLIDLRNMMEIRLLYDGKIAILLGTREELPYKLAAAQAVLQQAVTPQTIALLDVSVRPMMRLRAVNLYDPAIWPFPEELRADYERKIVKLPALAEPATDQPEEEVAAPSTADGEELPAEPSPTEELRQEDASSAPPGDV